MAPLRSALALALLVPLVPAGAQAWHYPTFQLPHLVPRELSFLVADGGVPAGESFIFQWREGRARAMQLSLDVGLANYDGRFDQDDEYFLVGGQVARQLVSAGRELPVGMLLAAGVYGAFGDALGNVVRVPVGVSVGRRFELQPALALTPYVFPRLALDWCERCGAGNDGETDLGVDIELGISLNVTYQFAVQLGYVASVSDDEFFWRGDDAFGVALAFFPRLIGGR